MTPTQKNERIDQIIDQLRQTIIENAEAWQRLTDLGVTDAAADRIISDVIMELL